MDSRAELDILKAAIEAALIPCGLARGPALDALDRLVGLAASHTLPDQAEDQEPSLPDSYYRGDDVPSLL